MSEKKVDESWKNAVQKEKENSSGEEAPVPLPEPNFSFFISSLGMQTLAALGEKTDMAQAQYLIDTIQMLLEKTKGNLTPEEDSMARGVLYELRMKFVQKTQEGSPVS